MDNLTKYNTREGVQPPLVMIGWSFFTHAVVVVVVW